MYTHDTLTVAVDERGGDLAVITPAGELEMATAPKLDQALRNAERRYEVVVLDLARLTFIDSSGIRTIFRTAQRAREGLFAFTIKPGSPTVPVIPTSNVKPDLPAIPDVPKAGK